MKRGLLFHVLVVLMLGLSLNMSLRCLAQQNTVALDAKSDAEYDAEDDVNTTLWLAAGGILGVAGNLPLGAVAVGGAYFYQPVPTCREAPWQTASIHQCLHRCLQSKLTQSEIECRRKGSTRRGDCVLLIRDD